MHTRENTRSETEGEIQTSISPEKRGDHHIASELGQRIQQIDQHPFFVSKQEAFQKLLKNIPEKAAQGYVKRIESALVQAEKSPVFALAQINGALFELSRIAKVLEQGLEQIDFQQTIDTEIAYSGFESKETDFSEKRRKPKKAKISSDVPILRTVTNEAGVEEQKLYVYETKCYPRMVYGASAVDRNQVLKYQQAIEHGQIAGATVEIAGRVNPAFLTWLIGESIVERGAAPDVDVIYSMELPSGAEYRLVLNGGQHKKGLRFSNDQALYSRDDQQVIAGIFRAVLDHSIVSILTSNEVKNPSDALRPLLDDPYGKIVTLDAFKEYTEGRKLNLQDALRKKAEAASINDKNERSSVEIMSYSEEEQIVALGQVFDFFQESLQHDPALQGMRDRYTVTDPTLRQEMIALTHEMVKKVAAFEFKRSTTQETQSRPGYRGKPEGVALAVDSIMFDAIYNILRIKKGEQTRSYEQPERFAKVTLDNVMQYLEMQERVYHTCEIYDPMTGVTESFVTDGTEAARKPIEKRKAKIAEENERRLQEAFQKAVATQTDRERELEAKTDRTSAEARELRMLAGKSTTTLREIKNLERAVEKRKEGLRTLSLSLSLSLSGKGRGGKGV